LAGQGDSDGALAHYTRSLQVAERLVAVDPDNVVWQRDLLISLNQVAGLLAGQGDSDGALAHYTRSLQIAERLVAVDPDNAMWQRDLLISHDNVGEVLAELGDTDGALEHYLRSLEIAERLAEADPDDAGSQANVESRHDKVAALLAGLGDADGALEHYLRSLEIAERLAEADPNNTDRQRELQISHNLVQRLRFGTEERAEDLPAGPWAFWEPMDVVSGADVLGRIAADLPALFGDSTLVGCRSSRLSFYRSQRLIELQFARDCGTGRAFVLDGPVDMVWLNGDSTPIHAINDVESLVLTQSNVADYVRFFFYFLRADEGAFILLESREDICPDGDVENHTDDASDGIGVEAARAEARPLRMRGFEATGRWLIDGTVAYGGDLFSTTIAVAPDGTVEMIDEDQIGTLAGLTVRQPPPLELKEQA
jgi:tetratricopeptide (TPR) repeat protein